MKTFWALALATIVTFSLSGCLEESPSPVNIQDVPAIIVPLPEPAEVAPVVEPAAIPPATVPPVIPPTPVVKVPPVVIPPTPEPVTDPLTEWFKNPAFTCEPGRAPGWLNDQGIPTSCVAN
jgi:type IV secretory pathway VirB10-like protein